MAIDASKFILACYNASEHITISNRQTGYKPKSVRLIRTPDGVTRAQIFDDELIVEGKTPAQVLAEKLLPKFNEWIQLLKEDEDGNIVPLDVGEEPTKVEVTLDDLLSVGKDLGVL